MRSIFSVIDPNSAIIDGVPFHKNDCKTQVNPILVPGERTGIFIISGQSLAANDVNALYTPTSPRVHNFSIYDGGMYLATDPQLSNDNSFQDVFGVPYGSMHGRIGDKLITAGVYDRVIVCPVAVSGSSIASWQFLNYNWRLNYANQRLVQIGLTPTAVLWEQGTADIGPPGMPSATYTNYFNQLVSTVRDRGLTCPWLIAKSTVADFNLAPGAQLVRAGQAAAVNPTNRVYAGPDSDTNVPTADRWDGTHDAATGADKRATGWKNAIQTAKNAGYI